VFAQQVRYVDVGATGGNNGASWADAYSDLPPALAAAVAGDEIWVTTGTYSAIQLKAGVEVYGGFSGNETARSQRDSQLNPTILGDGNSVVNGHIVDASNTNASAVLDGFIIQNGSAPDDVIGGVGGSGGGIFIQNGSPTIANCKVMHNTARLGSGVIVVDGSPTFIGCDISLNTSARSGEGTGIYAMTSTGAPPQLLTLIDCNISSNTALQGHFATGNGGGVYCGPGVDLAVSGCTIDNNFAAHNGSFGNATLGGGICFRGTTATISNSTFMQNIAAFGAGVYSEGTITCINCAFIGNRAVKQGCGGPECNGAPDLPSGIGGGVYALNATLTGCTLNANWAAKSGGGAVINGTVENCILWANRTPPVCCGEDPLPPPRDQIDGGVSILYSCVEGLLTPIPGECPPNPADFPGSIAVDPGFVQSYQVSPTFGWLTALGDIHLAAGSPCIDAGNNAAVPMGVTTDIDGNPRFVDDASTPDCPTMPGTCGTAPVVDMGAHEFGIIPVIGDVNCDGVLDINDAITLSSVLIGTDMDACHVASADLSGDGIVDGGDIQSFLQILLGP